MITREPMGKNLIDEKHFDNCGSLYYQISLNQQKEKHGLSVVFSNEKAISITKYKFNQKRGPQVYFCNNSLLNELLRVFSDGIDLPKGKGLTERYWINNMQNGEARKFNKRGKLISSESWKDNKRQGPERIFTPFFTVNIQWDNDKVISFKLSLKREKTLIRDMHYIYNNLIEHYELLKKDYNSSSSVI